MTFAEKKEKLLNALLERKGLPYIVDVAAETINNPMFIFDLSGKLIAKSQTAAGDETWNILFPDGHMVFEDMQSVENAGVIEYLIHNDMPIYGSFGFYPNRFLGCRIRDKSSALAIACVVENHPMHEEDEELLVVICKTVLFEMLYYERTAMQSIPYFSLFRDIIENNVKEDELKERIKSTRLKEMKSMRLMGIHHQKEKAQMSAYFTRESIIASVSGVYCIVYEGQILILADEQYWNDNFVASIWSCVSDTDCWMSISTVFQNLNDLAEVYQQLQAISEIREQMNFTSKTIAYEDIQFYHFFQIASKQMDIRLLANPTLKKIEDYDKTHNTNLLDSLEGYLEAGRNIQKAAKMMHMHKNTLYYRLQRITDLFGLNLEDENMCFQIQLSFRLMRMFLKTENSDK